ncbi:MAG: cupredoxin domain-containing protein [Gemmataceae bacterium]
MLGGLTSLIRADEVSAAPAPNVVKVTASKFHFSPDRIVLKKGVANTLQFTSNDTTHGFLLRPFNLDLDLAPGKVTSVTVVPPSSGTFRAICDHCCGDGHGDMKMTIVVE